MLKRALYVLVLVWVPVLSTAAKESESQGDSVELVDLTRKEQTTVLAEGGSHVLSNPWWQNIEFWGFGGAGYYDTGSGGTREYGSAEIKEATLFVDANVWKDTSFFIELQTNRLGSDGSKFVRTGEVYIHRRALQLTDRTEIGIKLGRFDIPFGEEYLWQDAVDNPLITNSAIYPYGWDEGILVYGHSAKFNWIVALTDGTDARSQDENADKALNLKVYKDVSKNLYLSASYMRNGANTKSAIEFGGSHFQPVTGSSVGSSASLEVDSELFELDAKYQFVVADMAAYVALSVGIARQDDKDSTFDRDFRWFSIEPYFQLTNHYYWVLRYSEIGTSDADEGYHFDGKTFAGGNAAFGFDVKRFNRLGIGMGWKPNPRLTVKLEIGRDSFDLIDASTIVKDDNRNFFGLEITASF